MSLLTFFGCLFLAYGPILSIFFLYIAPNAQYVLLMVSSAFFCLISLLLSSVIWYLAKSTQQLHFVSIGYSVAIQELFRWSFYLLLSRAEHGLNTVSAHPKSPFNRHAFSFVSGYGYALMSALVGYISLLVESIGPGVMMCPSCPGATLYFISAITTSLFSLMHMAWMMVSFDGFSELPKIRGWLKVIWVILSHYGASFATTLNSSTTVNYGCVYSIVICLFIIAVSAWIVFTSLQSRVRFVV
ncbi:gamma-secretase subunit Aph-1 [Gilbertella persicaria]|uniref:Anterior pharynx defective 1 n=1 Tax=Rhizopus stolonifer TaxID=4846 RepID=A0A367KKZ3_RHIST|nr:gamma-secretase subunit Aph-1 [Gilbertella persicaria]KAI8081888.1 gamma-secretase subunit Aph-1 [Gilbertella persicaria]RCI02800.1 anterior pharynx defective 1 [Rhizopus stolonifer]